MRLVACDARTVSLGVRPGMALADARVRIPELRAEAADPAADLRWLERIADACDRFTPLVAIDPPNGLTLDVTGCQHLFGDEAGMIAEVETRMRRWASEVRIAAAATPEAARALARHSSAPAPDEAAALRHLPITALELDAKATTALRRAGLKTIGALADRPPAPLAARFGPVVIDRLDRLLGRSDSRITPRRPAPSLAFERRFAEPVATVDAALEIIGELAASAALALEERQRGGRRFDVRLYRSDGHVIKLAVETGLPLRDPIRIMRLISERIGTLADPIDPGFGFDMIRLAIERDESMQSAQLTLEGGPENTEALGGLIDRLSARLGRERIVRFIARDSHMPEQTALGLPAVDKVRAASWPMQRPGEPPLRPTHLFHPPQPIEVTAAVDGAPQRFRWRRQFHDVARFEGPERIAPQWWRHPPGSPDLTRDYFRVEDMRGRRFWLFRYGLYGEERPTPRWYLHGLFA